MSLIIVLGILTVLTILAAAFIRSMRSERFVARGHSDMVRATHLAHVALIRAMEEVNRTTTNYCYPCWAERFTNGTADAMCSTGSAGACADILGRDATNMIPGAVRAEATSLTNYCQWDNIVSADGRTNGRIAYIVVNCSGLLDANHAGSTNITRVWSTNVNELDLSEPCLPDITNIALFCSNRDTHVRYETITELAKLNRGVTDPVSNLFIYSWDPGRDVYFTNHADLGFTNIVLLEKFRVNDLTNYASTFDPLFVTNYFDRLTNMLMNAGFSTNTRFIAWNIVDYIDGDHFTSSDMGSNNYVCEAVPLINEVALRTNGVLSYEVAVELWYPFGPSNIDVAAGFQLQTEIRYPPNRVLTNSQPVGPMAFGGVNEFSVFVSSSFTINVGGSNVPVSASQPVTAIVSVVNTSTSAAPAIDWTGLYFDNTIAYSRDDPRINTWTTNAPTLGAINAMCSAWNPGCQGLPIFHADGTMHNVGELGYIFTGEPWHDIDLLTTNGGALLDRMTVRPANIPAKGLINISTAPGNVIEAMPYNAPLWPPAATNVPIPDWGTLADTIVEISGSDIRLNNYEELLSSIGASWTNSSLGLQGNAREDGIRNIVELISFRQNIFTIIVEAQAFAQDGRTPVATKRAVAVVYRDSYTGKYFTRHLMWLGG